MRLPQWTAASDHSLLVSLGDEVSLDIHENVLRLSLLLKGKPGLLNIHPGYCSVLISFDPRRTAYAQVESAVREALRKMESVELPTPRTVEVPVRYGGADGPDLEDVARLHKIPADEVVRIHSAADYLVYFLGFSPGFPYLGGMPLEIATPRLGTPRRHVPAGSVGIGGDQTGIYPVASPGGWRIIGRTPLEIFRADRDPPTLLRMGDHVRFIPAAG
jgi:KipI family sensor histidine kinase inhibitor